MKKNTTTLVTICFVLTLGLLPLHGSDSSAASLNDGLSPEHVAELASSNPQTTIFSEPLLNALINFIITEKKQEAPSELTIPVFTALHNWLIKSYDADAIPQTDRQARVAFLIGELGVTHAVLANTSFTILIDALMKITPANEEAASSHNSLIDSLETLVTQHASLIEPLIAFFNAHIQTHPLWLSPIFALLYGLNSKHPTYALTYINFITNNAEFIFDPERSEETRLEAAGIIGITASTNEALALRYNAYRETDVLGDLIIRSNTGAAYESLRQENFHRAFSLYSATSTNGIQFQTSILAVTAIGSKSTSLATYFLNDLATKINNPAWLLEQGVDQLSEKIPMFMRACAEIGRHQQPLAYQCAKLIISSFFNYTIAAGANSSLTPFFNTCLNAVMSTHHINSSVIIPPLIKLLTSSTRNGRKISFIKCLLDLMKEDMEKEYTNFNLCTVDLLHALTLYITTHLTLTIHDADYFHTTVLKIVSRLICPLYIHTRKNLGIPYDRYKCDDIQRNIQKCAPAPPSADSLAANTSAAGMTAEAKNIHPRLTSVIKKIRNRNITGK